MTGSYTSALRADAYSLLPLQATKKRPGGPSPPGLACESERRRVLEVERDLALDRTQRPRFGARRRAEGRPGWASARPGRSVTSASYCELRTEKSVVLFIWSPGLQAVVDDRVHRVIHVRPERRSTAAVDADRRRIARSSRWSLYPVKQETARLEAPAADLGSAGRGGRVVDACAIPRRPPSTLSELGVLVA